MSHEREFTVDGLPEIEVRINAGRIELVGGEPGRVKVTVDGNDEDILIDQRGDLILISQEPDNRRLLGGSALVVVETPEHSDATISTASARVESRIPLGRVAVKTASGDVELAAAETADIKTASGDTRIASTSKALTCKSASGDLFVTGVCEGNVQLASASGDIHLAESTAAISLTSVSGDVRIPRFSGQKAEVKSMSGDVSIGIMAGTSLDLDASLLSGRLVLPDPSTRSGSPGQRNMTIRAKLVSGDLRIDRVEN